jgi:hypothetical protein
MFPEIGWLVAFLYGSYGLLGLFLAAVIGNATIFLPFPIDLLVFIIGTVITDP